ncbi:MAG: response regulator [Verrucomicrobiota bacterium]|jgi:CheY-like chemotaxis protein
MTPSKTNEPRLASSVPASPSAQPEANPAKTDRKRILVVDDQVNITRLLKLNLEQTNLYLVRTENDARAALAAAKEFQPHLILLDVMMPGMDGGRLAAQFQASPELKSVPIIFLTATVTHDEVLQRGGLVGGLPFLAKPVNLAEVLRCLRQHLR